MNQVTIREVLDHGGRFVELRIGTVRHQLTYEEAMVAWALLGTIRPPEGFDVDQVKKAIADGEVARVPAIGNSVSLAAFNESVRKDLEAGVPLHTPHSLGLKLELARLEGDGHDE